MRERYELEQKGKRRAGNLGEKRLRGILVPTRAIARCHDEQGRVVEVLGKGRKKAGKCAPLKSGANGIKTGILKLPALKRGSGGND